MQIIYNLIENKKHCFSYISLNNILKKHPKHNVFYSSDFLNCFINVKALLFRCCFLLIVLLLLLKI